METIFKEKQKFTQKWIYLVLIIAFITSIISVYNNYQNGSIDFNDINSYKGSLLTLGIVCLAFLLVIVSTLKTEVDSKGLRISYFPMFVKKDLIWGEIYQATIIKYGFVGGWGVRFFTKYGTVYNVRGNKGLLVELKNGKRFLVGTQEERKLAEAVKRYFY